jgi:8-oxo-dGTP pyrophosphatase MutT (NUDIX family)
MITDTTLFQYCQKLVVLSADRQSVLLAKRKGEADYDGVFSFVGGKMETTDESLLAGMQREKNEEIGPLARVRVLPTETYNLLFRKKDGNAMVLPHIAGIYVSGDIQLSDEYSEYRWVPLAELDTFEPKIDNIPQLARWAVRKLSEPDLELAEI